jgi:hypothetical protein
MSDGLEAVHLCRGPVRFELVREGYSQVFELRPAAFRDPES